jgi:hypothetical protein
MIMGLLKRIKTMLVDTFSDIETPEEAQYDPVHFGAMVVLTIFVLNILFWLLWSLLVFGGGIQHKVLPFLIVLFTSKTAADFGYIGYPYELGIFDGWVTNVVALGFCGLLVVALWYIFKPSHTR